MGEASSVDDSLGRVVVHHDALDLGQKYIAIANPGSGPAGLTRDLRGLSHSIFAQRMSACPFGCRPVPIALDPRFESRSPGKLRQHGRASAGIIARRGHVADAKDVRLIFLLTGEAQQPHLGKLLGALGNQPAKGIAANHRAEDLPQHTPYRARVGGGFARLGMIGGNVPGFMADDECQFGLIVHDAHQLASDVNIAARYREGILDRAVQGREVIGLAGIGGPGISRDAAPDSFDIGSPRTCFGAAEFGDDLRMLPGSFLHLSRVEIARLLDLCRGRGDDRRCRGEQNKGRTHRYSPSPMTDFSRMNGTSAAMVP